MLDGSQVVTIDMRTTRRTATERPNGCDSRPHVIFPGSPFLLRKDTRESLRPQHVCQCDGKRDLCNRPGALAVRLACGASNEERARRGAGGLAIAARLRAKCRVPAQR